MCGLNMQRVVRNAVPEQCYILYAAHRHSDAAIFQAISLESAYKIFECIEIRGNKFGWVS